MWFTIIRCVIACSLGTLKLLHLGSVFLGMQNLISMLSDSSYLLAYFINLFLPLLFLSYSMEYIGFHGLQLFGS